MAHRPQDSPLRRPVDDAGWASYHSRAAGLVSALDRMAGRAGRPDAFIVWPEGALFADGLTTRRMRADDILVRSNSRERTGP